MTAMLRDYGIQFFDEGIDRTFLLVGQPANGPAIAGERLDSDGFVEGFRRNVVGMGHERNRHPPVDRLIFPADQASVPPGSKSE